MYRWALHRRSFETNKWTVFLEIEAAFPIVIGQTKSPGSFGLAKQVFIMVKYKKITGRRKVVFICFRLCKSLKFPKTKTYSFISMLIYRMR